MPRHYAPGSRVIVVHRSTSRTATPPRRGQPVSDHLRRGLAFVIAIGMVIAVATAPTVAQEVTGETFDVAGLSADTVDGRHAVAYTTAKRKRAGKLVATNSQGFLPSNILRPQWRVIQNMPAGFADGEDQVGITGLTVTSVWGPQVTVAANDTQWAAATCPAGTQAIGGGYHLYSVDLTAFSSFKNNSSEWRVNARNPTGTDRTMKAFVTCVGTKNGKVITTASKGAKPAGLRRAGK